MYGVPTAPVAASCSDGDCCFLSSVLDVGIGAGDASAVDNFLNENDLNLKSILITHHHYDHTGGIIDLASKWNPKVFGPKGGHINGIDLELSENAKIEILDTRTIGN